MKNKNKGFTLVELIVTMVILSILLGLSAMGMMAWQDWSDFNRVNEYAETMFLAAQHQLAEYSSNGTLADFSARVEKVCDSTPDDEIVHLDSIYYLENATYTADKVWTTEKGTIVSLRAERGDYTRYQQGGAEATKSATARFVFELLQAYLYDQTLLNDTICIEYSLEDGQVFAVLYTDKYAAESDGTEYESFVYSGAEDNIRGQVNISRRYESYCKERMVGYYGVDTLTRVQTEKLAKPVITNVKLNNEDTLNLTFKLIKQKAATTRLTYDITFYDMDSSGRPAVLKLELKGEKLKNYDHREEINCRVDRYVYDEASKTMKQQTVGAVNFLAWLEEDNTVRLILDAADIQATTKLYRGSLPVLAGDVSAAAANPAYGDYSKFLTTYSFHRFGLDVNNVYCSVQGRGTLYKNTTSVNSNPAAVYFAEYENAVTTKDGAPVLDQNCKLANGRHLYNIRYLTDLEKPDYKYLKPNVNGIDENSLRSCHYELKNDIDWTAFAEGGEYYDSNHAGVTYASGLFTGLYNPIGTAPKMRAAGSGDILTVKSGYFASFKKLGPFDDFRGHDLTVKGLRINNAFSYLSGVYDNTDTDDKPVGLFLRNYGVMENIKLDNICVSGIAPAGTSGLSGNMVGAFCGVDIYGNGTGVLRNLEVKNTGINTVYASEILGVEHVGGIVGYLKSGASSSGTTDVEFENLVNGAKVTGLRYLGGIVGKMRTTSADNALKLTKCRNTGAVIARSDMGETKTEACYIGGITGYIDNDCINAAGQRDQNLITLSECVSTPEYSAMDILGLLDSTVVDPEQMLKSKLRGVYVGGVVGYNSYGTIRNCSTEAESGKTGYVFGYKYVGGIVGYNVGPLSGIAEGTSKSRGVNAANVLGCMYVGGITGCNAQMDSVLDPADNTVVPDKTRTLKNKIEHWTNKGIVFAADSYAGGITGYNAGWIYDCTSEVDNNETDGFFQKTYSGSYAGGITGYNNGIIGNTKRDPANTYAVSDEKTAEQRKIPAICYITGTRYVGGIVGYNDVDAIVEDYAIVGGRIRGNANSVYVGGYAGFNTSVYLLQDEDGVTPHNILSNPNEVTGGYCVGGSIGGNMINVNNKSGEIKAKFRTDNFLGEVNGKAFVGGFIGYNVFVDSSDEKYVEQLNNTLAGEFVDANSQKDTLEKCVNLLDGLQQYGCDAVGGFDTNEDIQLYIKGDVNDKTSTLGTIKGELYLGGVIGYNDDTTRLYIQDVTNATPITSSDFIVDADGKRERDGNTRDYRGEEKEYRYSYTGGIIGKVSRNTTLDNCGNSTTGVVTNNATFTGGLCELNAGRIINCSATATGSSVTGYVASLCGLNGKTGTIENCKVMDVSINGRNMVGGMVVENFGTIINPWIDRATMVVSGQYAVHTVNGVKQQSLDGVCGAVAAYNEGVIILKSDLTGINISSGGSFVGAVAGINRNAIRNGKAAEAKAGESKEITVTGNIIGYGSVGGFIGLNESADKMDVDFYVNRANVTANYSLAGGIVGQNTANSNIAHCANYGVVTAWGTNIKEGEQADAGGITAFNAASITGCASYKEVKAPNGRCGGIAATNIGENSRISNCTVMPVDDGNGTVSNLTFVSRSIVGGITAINEGTIYRCMVKNVTVENYNIENNTKSDYCEIGVVCGRNEKTGIIAIGAGEVFGEGCVAQTSTNLSRLGGVTGVNKNKICSITENGSDRAKVVCQVGFVPGKASIAAMGGVTGANYGWIENISVLGTITGNLGSPETGYGGVAGMSGSSQTKEKEVTCKIVNCTFDGQVRAYGSFDNKISIGGITGINYGDSQIESCVLGAYDDGFMSNITNVFAGNVESTATDGASYAYLGGVAGRSYGSVVSCNNSDYSKDNVTIELFAGSVGGIVGFGYEGAVVTGRERRILSTGKNWKINVRSSSNDSGQGGIIGYTTSGQPIGYTENHADITYTGTNNVSIGGIIGRTENYSETNARMDYCINYGNCISKGWKAGGFIGSMKYQGITMENCKNYGQIGTSGNNVGGFIAALVDVYYDVTFRNCVNYGNVINEGYNNNNAVNAGGFIGGEQSKGEAAVHFYDCVNVGNVQNKTPSTAGGFVGKAADYKFTFYDCRNYGTGPAYGIIAQCGSLEMEKCLDFNGSNKDIDSMKGTNGPLSHGANQIGNSNDNYYLNGNSAKNYPVPCTYFTYTQKNAANSSNINPTIKYVNRSKSKPTQETWPGGGNLIQLDDSDLHDANGNNVDGRLAIYGCKSIRLTFDMVTNQNDAVRGMRVYFTNSGDPTRNQPRFYQIDAKFMAADGTVRYTGSIATDPNHGVTYEDWENCGLEIEIPAEVYCADVRKVELVITATTSGVTSVNLRGIRWLSYREGEYKTLSSAPTVEEPDTVIINIDSLVSTQKTKFESITKQGTRLYVNPNSNGTYQVISRVNQNLSFKMEHNPVPADYTAYVADNAARLSLYEEFDPLYFNVVHQSDDERQLSAPKLSEFMNVVNSNYVVSWEKVQGAYGYDLTYQLVDASDNAVPGYAPTTVRITGTNQYAIAREEDWHLNGYKIKVSVCAIHPRHVLDNDDSLDSPVSDKCYDCVAVLPIPLYHLEMLAQEEAGWYVAVLDNLEDYTDAAGNILDCEIRIHVKCADTSIKETSDFTIIPAKGPWSTQACQITYAYGKGTNLSAQTVPGESIQDAFANSTTKYNYIAAVGVKDLNSTDTKPKYGINSVDFYGSKPAELEYRIKFNPGNNFYLASDLIGYSEQLGMDISYAHGVSYNVEGNGIYTTTALNPQNIRLFDHDTFSAVIYFWASQSEVIHYGHEVVSDLTLTSREELMLIEDKNYLIEENGVYRTDTVSVWDTAKDRLKDGYILYLNPDGSYSMVYSALMECYQSRDEENTKQYQVWRRVFSLSDALNSGYHYYTNNANTSKLNLEPKPVIDKKVVRGVDNGKNTYTFSWDTGTYFTSNNTIKNMYKNANYMLKLTGVSIDGTEVILETPDVYVNTTIGQNRYTFVDTEGNWNYTKLLLDVTRVDNKNSSTKTSYLPQTARQEFDVKLKFATMGLPSVTLSRNEDATFDKNNLFYDVTFAPVTDENELEDLGGYLITVRRLVEPGGPEKVHYHYFEDVPNTAEEDVIGLDLDELAKKGSVTRIESCKRVTEPDEDGIERVTQMMVKIDLGDFDGNDNLLVTIQPIARKGAVNFEDGAPSPGVEITMPKRFETPSANVLSADVEYNYNVPISISQINDSGVTLLLKQAEDVSWRDTTGRYQIAVAVYDEAGYEAQQAVEAFQEDSFEWVGKTGDAPAGDDNGGYWNSGAVKTFVPKEAKEIMKGSTLANAKYVIRLPEGEAMSDYAGMWLKVTLRTTTDNSISSLWADEDKAEAKTVNYKWLQIPRVALDTPGLTGNEVEKFTVAERFCGDKLEWSDTPTAALLAVRNRVLKLNTDKYADAYVIKLLTRDNTPAKLVLERQADESYKVFYEDGKQSLQGAPELSAFMTCGKLLGSLSDASPAVTVEDFCGTIPVQRRENDTDSRVDVPISMVLKYEQGEISIVLPDVLAKGSSLVNLSNTGDEYYFTRLVTVQAVLAEEKMVGYRNSALGSWRRSSAVNDAGDTVWSEEVGLIKDADAIEGIATNLDVTLTGKEISVPLVTGDVSGGDVSGGDVSSGDVTGGNAAGEPGTATETETRIRYAVSVAEDASTVGDTLHLVMRIRIADSQGTLKQVTAQRVTLQKNGSKYTGDFELVKDDYFDEDNSCELSVIQVSERVVSYEPSDWVPITAEGARVTAK